jgi:hypothetical protein
MKSFNDKLDKVLERLKAVEVQTKQLEAVNAETTRSRPQDSRKHCTFDGRSVKQRNRMQPQPATDSSAFTSDSEGDKPGRSQVDKAGRYRLNRTHHANPHPCVHVSSKTSTVRFEGDPTNTGLDTSTGLGNGKESGASSQSKDVNAASENS